VADIKRISGYRINFLEPKVRQFRFAKMAQDLQPLLHLIDLAKQEPLYLDDALASRDNMQVLGWGLNTGELFVVINEKAIIALVKLTFIIPERQAEMDVWVVPSMREGYKNAKIISGVAKEIIQYAFSPWTGVDGAGLGLMKIKATICANNLAALKAARALKFKQCGMSPLDAFYQGAVYDTVKLELHNPAYFAPIIEDLPHGITARTELAELPSTTSLHEPDSDIAASAGSSPTSGDSEPDIGERELDTGDSGEPSPELPRLSVHGKPFKPRRTNPV
jgi:RimJ/RimL family protein N-acetyltransferase